MDTIVVDQGRSSMYGFVEPQTIQPSGNTLQNRYHYLQTWMDESKRDVYLVPYIEGRMKNDLRTMLQGVIGKSRGQLVQILYPKVCNQQLESWEYDFYVMCWIKTIIRAVITDDWNERFKSTSPIPEDTIRQIRTDVQEAEGLYYPVSRLNVRPGGGRTSTIYGRPAPSRTDVSTLNYLHLCHRSIIYVGVFVDGRLWSDVKGQFCTSASYTSILSLPPYNLRTPNYHSLKLYLHKIYESQIITHQNSPY
ncbi:hypothetical protein LR48_Vigan03g016900 [Vigna angularis]|uniref:Uncharacterized protein n=1 Tax=Phaseolus angularis TaxID=3914 RepID=A0A0L9U1T6_PHAAN|nr:hypothetical protein LR48_Vigan03g016900 [Vigna angularis]